MKKKLPSHLFFTPILFKSTKYEQKLIYFILFLYEQLR